MSVPCAVVLQVATYSLKFLSPVVKLTGGEESGRTRHGNFDHIEVYAVNRSVLGLCLSVSFGLAETEMYVPLTIAVVERGFRGFPLVAIEVLVLVTTVVGKHEVSANARVVAVHGE